jgi:multicomponent Na+:H+ antiporter subunit C
VLTAIVIGFALMCFALVLVRQLVQRAGVDDALQLRLVEPEPTDPVKPPMAVDEPGVQR